MTVQQAVEYLGAVTQQHLEEQKWQAILLGNQAVQIHSAIASLMDKNAEFIQTEKIYPGLFKHPQHAQHMTEEKRTALESLTWRAFLGI